MTEEWAPHVFDYFTADQLVDEDDLNPLNNSLRFLEEVGYVEFTSDVSVTATTEATANSVVALGSITYEAVPHMLEFFSPSARPDSGAAGRFMQIVLFDSTTAMGQLSVIQTPAAAAMLVTVYAARRFTPTAAAHTYNVKAHVSAGTGLIRGGPGVTADDVPGYIRITRIPT